MIKSNIRPSLFVAGLVTLFLSIFYNVQFMNHFGETITGLTYTTGIILLLVSAIYHNSNLLAPLDQSVPKHSRLKASVAGILITVGVACLFSFIISVLALVNFRGMHDSERFFAISCALSLIMTQNFGLGVLFTWLWNRRIMNENYYAKIPFTEYYFLIGEARNHKEVVPNNPTA